MKHLVSEVSQLLVYPDHNKVAVKNCGMKLGTGFYVVTKNGSETEWPIRATKKYSEISKHFKEFGAAATNVKYTESRRCMYVGVQTHFSAALSPGMSPGTICPLGRFVPGIGMDGCKENTISCS
jgi:hypothetical protein